MNRINHHCEISGLADNDTRLLRLTTVRIRHHNRMVRSGGSRKTFKQTSRVGRGVIQRIGISVSGRTVSGCGRNRTVVATMTADRGRAHRQDRQRIDHNFLRDLCGTAVSVRHLHIDIVLTNTHPTHAIHISRLSRNGNGCATSIGRPYITA